MVPKNTPSIGDDYISPPQSAAGLAGAIIAGLYTDRTVERPSSIDKFAGRKRQDDVPNNDPDINLNPSIRHDSWGYLPTNWNGYEHSNELRKTYDGVCKMETGNRQQSELLRERVMTTRNRMFERFPELEEGVVPLSKEWIEHALKLADV